MPHAARATLVALVLAAVPVGLRAQARVDTIVQAREDTRAQRIYQSLMSPFCPGLTVASCPSPGAEQMRQEVRQRLAAGDGERTIVAALVEEYGSDILGAPPARRWGLALWIPPALALLMGGGALALWLRRRASPTEEDDAQAGAEAAPETDPVLQSRLEEALRAFDGEV
jgi:cytochrome c-type biogenesis protein CcmH